MGAARESERCFLAAGTRNFVTRSAIVSKLPVFGQLGPRTLISKALAPETSATKAVADVARS
jgi:hypothetical protein